MKAFKNIALISLITILGVTATLFLLRWLAFQTSYKERESLFLDSKGESLGIMSPGPGERLGFHIVALGGDAGEDLSPHSLESLDRALQISRDIVLEMDVHQTKEEDLVVSRGLTKDGDPLGEKLLLEEALGRYRTSRIVLDIKSNVPNIHIRLYELLKTVQMVSRVIIQSDYDLILSAIKQLDPKIKVGTGQGEMTRAMIFASLFLEPMSVISGDIFVSPLYKGKEVILSNRLIQELHRRHLPVFVSSIESYEELKVAFEKGVDGVMTARPSFIFHSMRELALSRKK